ncbi:uncharacterized protein LOC135168514 isoform X1 [Diachasmimorpha longicaudata]|uniref:uncharacterized protein LOC135168514 isoform X1 n=1 Tax=Diachasmimorpha longicaudata TaxID=58733 RepID=UPI0030B87A07
MAECLETTYNPEVVEHVRKEQERRVVQEGTTMWKKRKAELQHQKHREQRELRQMQSSYSPWGKPGGGAPCERALRKKNVHLEPLELPRSSGHGQLARQYYPWGRPGPGGAPWRDPRMLGVRFLESMGWTTGSVLTRVRGKDVIDPLTLTDSNKFFDERARTGLMPDPHPPSPIIPHRDVYNEEMQMYKLTGGVELVPLLTTRRHYSHPSCTRYLTTDATRPGYTIDSLRSVNIGNREHITALTEQMHRKRERALEERRVEQEGCRRHFDTWKKLWGRPGHGAPMDHYYRTNLHSILYRMPVY